MSAEDSYEKYFITDRLLLRPWEPTDAYDLYAVAKDEEVARFAGWLHHTSPEYSMKIIEGILSYPGTYAIVPKSVGKAVGSISLKHGDDTNITLCDGEAELGYWIGKEYWGNGYVPEAARTLIDYGIKTLRMSRIWCICRTDNLRSMRVQNKCGFRFVRNGTINDPVYGELEMRFTCIDAE